MKRFSQLFFVLSQLKLSVNFKILFSLMVFKEAVVILSFMYYFLAKYTYLPTYLPTYLEIRILVAYSLRLCCWCYSRSYCSNYSPTNVVFGFALTSTLVLQGHRLATFARQLNHLLPKRRISIICTLLHIWICSSMSEVLFKGTLKKIWRWSFSVITTAAASLVTSILKFVSGN